MKEAEAIVPKLWPNSWKSGESCSEDKVMNVFYSGQAAWSILSICLAAQVSRKKHRSIKRCHTCILWGYPQRSLCLSRAATHLVSMYPSFPPVRALKAAKCLEHVEVFDTAAMFPRRTKSWLKIFDTYTNKSPPAYFWSCYYIFHLLGGNMNVFLNPKSSVLTHWCRFLPVGINTPCSSRPWWYFHPHIRGLQLPDSSF